MLSILQARSERLGLIVGFVRTLDSGTVLRHQRAAFFIWDANAAFVVVIIS